MGTIEIARLYRLCGVRRLNKLDATSLVSLSKKMEKARGIPGAYKDGSSL